MRTIFIILLLANGALAQQRTWTITTAVVTAEAELLGVRGDVVYLKVGDKIESVPLARLSVADHEYLASVSLAPVRTNTVAGEAVPELLPSLEQGSGIPTYSVAPAVGTVTEEAIPLPSNVVPPPTSTTSAGATSRGTTSTQSTATRGGAPITARSNTTASARRRGATTTTTRRLVTPPTNQTQSASRGNANTNDSPGILGLRGRNRQRGR